jgi:hypothetical protein
MFIKSHKIDLTPEEMNYNFSTDTTGRHGICFPDLIRKRAHQLFEERARRPGRELDDWLQAECELKYHFGLR